MASKKKRAEIPPNTPSGGFAAKGIDLTFEKGLPANTDAEKFILGSVMKLGLEVYTGLVLTAEDFSLERHRRIWLRMADLAARAEKIDRVTVANELIRQGQLESVDGLTYLSSMDEGLPESQSNLDAYVRIVQEKARLRKIIFSAQKTIDTALIAEQDSSEIAGELNEKLSEIQTATSITDKAGQSPLQVVESFPGGANAFLDPTQRMRGLPTGFKKIDEMIGGLKGGEVYIIAARPSVGKTAWAMNVAQHLTMDPLQARAVSIFNLEMSAESLLLRMACAVARVDQHKMRLGFLNKDERYKLQVAISELTDNVRLKFYDKLYTMPEISRAVRQDVKEGMHLAIVDYLQLIQPPPRASDNQNLAMEIISRDFKLLAKETDKPMMVLSQLSRQTERRTDTRPQLGDLRNSGAIEQDADLVGFLYREELYRKDRADLKGLAEFIIAKQRNGPIGKVDLRFIHQYVKFEDRSDEREPEGQ